MILFMTDGADTSGLPILDVIADEQQKLGSEVVIFTYSFGSGVSPEDAALPRKIACQNQGVAYVIPDGSDLGDVMSQYYTYFANAKKSDQTRWVKYADSFTEEILMAGCLPVYDPDSVYPSVVGVFCIDLNIIMSFEELQNQPG